MKIRNFKILTILCLLMLIMFAPTVKTTAQAIAINPITIATTDGGEGNEENGGELGGGELENTEEPSEPETVPFEGMLLDEEVITDKQLRSALLSLYRNAYDPTDLKYYAGDKIYSDMFIDFEEINIDKKGITSLDGFEELELDNLVSFSANSNSINTFSKDYLRNIDDNKFTSLSLANNNLSSIDLVNMEHLTNLDLSTNKISSIDLSVIEGKTSGTRLNINLAYNNLDSMADIIFPSKRIGHIELNIINNNITDITDTFFTEMYTMHIGIQGFVTEQTTSVDTAHNLLIYPLNREDLAVEVVKTDGEEDEIVATISDEDIVDNFLRLDLPVGEYEYYYTINGSKINKPSRDYQTAYLVTGEFYVIPQKATYLFTHKGKTSETLGKVTGKVTVTLATVEEGAKIFYQVNGGDWVEGSVIECDKGGSYSIKVKTVIGDYESEIENIWVRTSLNLYVPDALMFVLIMLLTLVLFFVIIPIISKKYFKKD